MLKILKRLRETRKLTFENDVYNNLAMSNTVLNTLECKAFLFTVHQSEKTGFLR